MGMAYLASALRTRGHDVTIVDGELHRRELTDQLECLLESRARIVGFSVLHSNLAATAAAMVALRRRGFRGDFAIGGYFGSFHDRELLAALPERAVVVRGEAEQTFPLLVEALEGGGGLDSVPGITFVAADGSLVRTAGTGGVQDLDDLPLPARDTLSEVFGLGNPVVSVVPARGCVHHCDFCSIIAFHRTSGEKAWRERSPARVVDEIEDLFDRPEVREARADFVWFVSDEFVGPLRGGLTYAERLANEILARRLVFRWEIACRVDQVERELFRKLKEAGLRSVYVGIESFCQEDLDRFRKGTRVEQNREALEVLRNLGLSYTLGTIVFNEGASFEGFKETHDELKGIGYRHVTMPLARMKDFLWTGSPAPTGDVPAEFDDVLSASVRRSLSELSSRIYSYQFKDARVATLHRMLVGLRQKNETLVAIVVDLLDRRLVDAMAFWKLVFVLRDGLAALIDRAIDAAEGELDEAETRRAFEKSILRARGELDRLAHTLTAGGRSPISLELHGRPLLLARDARPVVLPGTELGFAEREYLASDPALRLFL
jgi:radical SAM superfamily enzyme YgiQ (UPF0313 family)